MVEREPRGVPGAGAGSDVGQRQSEAVEITAEMVERAAYFMDVAANGAGRANRDGPDGGPARDHWRRIARGALGAAFTVQALGMNLDAPLFDTPQLDFSLREEASG